jgi:3-oxoacyl-[acyl-carrier protein] reductase
MAENNQNAQESEAPPRAIVTGGSRGIGRAIALGLARQGYTVSITGRDPVRLATVAAEIEAVEPTADTSGAAGTIPTLHRSFAADLADPEETARLAADLREAFPYVNLLVLNAGIACSRTIAETSDVEWDRIFHVNVRAPFVIARELIPALRVAGGRVMVIGSVVSRAAYPLQGAYTASKHALYGFTKVLAKELHEDGVIVQTVLPGGVDTAMIHGVRPDIDTTDLIRPEDVADTVLAMLQQRGNAVVDEISLRRRGKQPWA